MIHNIGINSSKLSREADPKTQKYFLIFQIAGFCFESEESFLDKSEAKDLSDVWSNLGVTMDHLRRYGHQVYDLIVQCTYNANDCFNQR